MEERQGTDQHVGLVEQERAGARTAVATEVVGRSFVTGVHDFVFDPDDPLNGGFLIGTSE